MNKFFYGARHIPVPVRAHLIEKSAFFKSFLGKITAFGVYFRSAYKKL